MTRQTATRLTDLLAIRNSRELEFLKAEADVLAFLASKAVVVRDARPKLDGEPERIQAAQLPARARAFFQEGLEHRHD